MVLYEVSFPGDGLCVIAAGEERENYQAALTAQYLHSRALYQVRGKPPEETSREEIERAYGVDVFRMEVINRALVFEYPALQAEVCARYDLTPLTEPEPRLLHESDDGYQVEVSFYTVPRLALGTITATAEAGPDGAAARTVEESGYEPPAALLQTVAEQRREEMTQRIREELETVRGQQQRAMRDGAEAQAAPLQARRAMLEQLLRQAEEGDEGFCEKLRVAARAELLVLIGLYNIAWQQGLAATKADVEAEIDRMVAISAQNAYARGNASAQQSIARRVTMQRAREWLRGQMGAAE